MRVFAIIAQRWELTDRDQAVLLGQASRSITRRWMRIAVARDQLTLPYPAIMRLSAMIGIQRAFDVVAAENENIAMWLRWPRIEKPFSGRAPLDLARDGFDGLMAVRRYLDGRRSGRWLEPEVRKAAGVPDTLSDDNIRFLN